LPEASLAPAVSAPHEEEPFFQPDCDWMSLETLEDEDLFSWPGWLEPVNPAPIAEDYVHDALSTPPPSTAAATPSCDAASEGEKRLRPKLITAALRCWLEPSHKPYASLAEQKLIAEALNISVSQVTNFCNNYRKRYAKVGGKLTSYSAACLGTACR
jgi:hypothetical protein